MIRTQTLGAPFVMYYNAKVKNGYERIGMALSTNMVNWKRFGTNHVLANGEAKRNGFCGDPQIVKIGDVWVMFYFGCGWAPKAFDTFACSRDLVNWTKWTGPHLVEPTEPWDKTYAHKPWVLKHDGVVYHFYCAVGNEGRVIGARHFEGFAHRQETVRRLAFILTLWLTGHNGAGSRPLRDHLGRLHSIQSHRVVCRDGVSDRHDAGWGATLASECRFKSV